MLQWGQTIHEHEWIWYWHVALLPKKVNHQCTNYSHVTLGSGIPIKNPSENRGPSDLWSASNSEFHQPKLPELRINCSSFPPWLPAKCPSECHLGRCCVLCRSSCCFYASKPNSTSHTFQRWWVYRYMTMRQFDAGDVWEVSRSISRVLIEGYRGICIMKPVGQHFTKMVPESIGKNMLVRCLFLWMTWGLVLSGWRVGRKGYEDLRKEVTRVHLGRGFQRRLWDVPLLSTGASWIKYMPIPLQNAYVKKNIYKCMYHTRYQCILKPYTSVAAASINIIY